jgi:hypothetical protein
VRTRSESYLRTAERAHQQAETALSPQEKDLLLTIERSLRRLAEIEDWQDEVEHAKGKPNGLSRFSNYFEDAIDEGNCGGGLNQGPIPTLEADRKESSDFGPVVIPSCLRFDEEAQHGLDQNHP